MHSAEISNQFNSDAVNPAVLINGEAKSRVLLICEHASHHIPLRYDGLGLSEADKLSHAAWDPGAFALSIKLCELLDAALVSSTVSRLVYDCNRPPSSPDAMRGQSEEIIIPGNENLTSVQQAERVRTVYEPFNATVEDVIKQRGNQPILVTIHSFTKVYFGNDRTTEIGIIHHDDDVLAKTMIDLAKGGSGLSFEMNEPYSQNDGVAHTLQIHGTENGLINVMLEVRNDLIQTTSQHDDVAKQLAKLIKNSLIHMGEDIYGEISA